ncbi:uncharacterized protein LOC132875630 isoform X2 [Neoarius graeffei]|uniref:uncharacterized protein LOC132875630 isoform X2 n=1 Tax=Neoarius graeffei TaxID=443677 RepID=UPI00298C6A93|nr:uncharacterized protein LOC132875630 isoform X2 [Neoarius graeffei]
MRKHCILQLCCCLVQHTLDQTCARAPPGQQIMSGKLPCYEFQPGNIGTASKQFTERLQKERKSMKMKTKTEDCKAVLFYWPIISRAGSDIQTALQKLQSDYKGKYVALVLFHHTFDPETIVPDSSRDVNSENQGGPENPIVVDCLFHENKGLLHCRKNDEAVKKVAAWLRSVEG